MGGAPSLSLSLAIVIDTNMEMIAGYSATISWFPWKPDGGVCRRSLSVGLSSSPSAWTCNSRGGNAGEGLPRSSSAAIRFLIGQKNAWNPVDRVLPRYSTRERPSFVIRNSSLKVNGCT